MLRLSRSASRPVQTNAYLIADPQTREAAVIDPAWDGHIILAEALQRGWRIGHLWYTRTPTFDHIGGAAAIADALNPLPLVALHPADHVLWRAGGAGVSSACRLTRSPNPPLTFTHGQILAAGVERVRRCGTSPATPQATCCSTARQNGCASARPLIFARAAWGAPICRAAAGSRLIHSIRTQVYTLPDDTRLLSGHGPETTVGVEKVSNPFVQEY